MASNSEWANAYRRQAASDFKIYRHLADSDVPGCHALHHLQMATEKIAKAYRLVAEPGATPESVKVHGLGNFVQVFFSSPRSVERLGLGSHNAKHARRKLVDVANNVERLVPAGLKHRNAEYPWEVGGAVRVPTDESYDDLGPSAAKFIDFLNFLAIAIDDFGS